MRRLRSLAFVAFAFALLLTRTGRSQVLPCYELFEGCETDRYLACSDASTTSDPGGDNCVEHREDTCWDFCSGLWNEDTSFCAWNDPPGTYYVPSEDWYCVEDFYIHCDCYSERPLSRFSSEP
jgi:hypothetical protein